MPLTHLIDPTLGKKIPLEEAAEYFEQAGLMPAPVINAIIRSERENEKTRCGDRVSPSMATPDALCRREHAIKRNLPYGLNPLTLWEAMEGTVWHSALLPEEGEDWDYEVAVGPVELFGVSLSGHVDGLRKDRKKLIDIKTQRFSKKDWGMKDDWRYQTSIYCHIIHAQYGVMPEPTVWRIYRGSYERERTFRRFNFEVVPLDKLEKLVGGFLKETQQILGEATTAEKIATLALEGERMFGGKKCDMYCSVKDLCFSMSGKPVF